MNKIYEGIKGGEITLKENKKKFWIQEVRIYNKG